MLIHWIWYAQVKGISLHRKHQLLEHFRDPEEIYHSEEAVLLEAGADSEILQALENKDLSEAGQIIARCNAKGIGILTFTDPCYPSRLRNIPDAPPVLYYAGLLPGWNTMPVIGIVGTRSASTYGERMAKRFGAEIAQCGALVISGGATGIDTAAMEGAVSAQRPTVGVLACGVDITYPRTNGQFFRKVQTNGCLLSEYPPQTKPAPWQFLDRNRLISGMSNGLLVVEAPEKSGALNTARHALEQGRDVFAVPGNVDTLSCQGSNALLAEGAAPALSGWSVVREYAADFPGKVWEKPAHLENPSDLPTKSDKKSIDKLENSTYSVLNKPLPALSESEQAVLAQIGAVPVALDNLIEQVDLPAMTVKSILTRLTVKGHILSHPGGRVSRK